LSATALLLLSILLGCFKSSAGCFFLNLHRRALRRRLLLILFFGAINLFAVGLVGEYIAKIFEEVKQRPLFIRRSIIREGEVRRRPSKRSRRGRNGAAPIAKSVRKI